MKKLIVIGLFLVAVLMSGCKVINYSDTAGRTVKITVWGYDTKIGHLEAQAADGTRISFDNYDATATAVQTANKALDLANAIANRVPAVP